MSTMVERVARAVFEDAQFDNEAKYSSWDRASEGAREDYRNMVRLVIRAMREPTTEMHRAGCFTESDDPGQIWRDMIDAALTDPKPPDEISVGVKPFLGYDALSEGLPTTDKQDHISRP